MIKNQKLSLNNFVRIANSYLDNSDTSIEGIEKYLIGWFVTQFNTTLNDQRLLDMTFEELLVLYNIYKIKEDPEIVNQILNPEDPDGFEKWLKEEMGDNYLSEEEMIEDTIKRDKELKKKLEEYPDEIVTDFSKLGE